ncbi:MAG: hypothetical protein CVU72_07610 [Deltaproteobacteria bacterium HGW-Deltaproteobacteria-7]|nr:MAG: hypothetical protein CVU72_07610 [Deltaproteobacteria bacterium HGW-Deltaproteobacteria-7]
MEVTPEDGEKLAHAATQGRVVLTLRNPTDTAAIVTKGATVPILLSSLGAPVAKSARVARSTVVHKAVTVVNTTKPVYVIQGIRGGAVTEYKFEKEGEK